MITNGKTERVTANGNQPALIGEVRSFVAHARQLASLQAILLAKDLKESHSRFVSAATVLVFGAILFAGCVPVVIVATGIIIANWTQLGVGWSLLIVGGIVLAVAAALVLTSIGGLRGSMRAFDRSRDELGKNLDSLFGELDNTN